MTNNPPPRPTSVQLRALRAVAGYIDARHQAPSIDDLAELLGTSRSATAALVARLVKRGYLARDPHRRRSLHLMSASAAFVPVAKSSKLPLLGSVRAGAPSLAEEDVEDLLDVPRGLLPPGTDGFLLRAEGDSMVGAGILHGDILVISRQEVAEDGAIVIALAGDDEAADEATVKHLHTHRDGSVELRPANPTYPTQTPAFVKVLGVVRGLIRSLA